MVLGRNAMCQIPGPCDPKSRLYILGLACAERLSLGTDALANANASMAIGGFVRESHNTEPRVGEL